VPDIVKGERELRTALEAADCSAVMFEANLGPTPIANRERLGHHFSAGIRAAAMKKAEEGGWDPVEAVRLTADAVSCVTDISFLGQATSKFVNKFKKDDPRNGKFCTMPLKLTFPDRSARIHFERIMRTECDLRATISLPQQVREVQGAFNRTLREKYPDTPISIRLRADKLRLEAFIKEGEERTWTRATETCDLDPAIMLPGWPGVPGGPKRDSGAARVTGKAGASQTETDMTV
jgi:hypothetical protein